MTTNATNTVREIALEMPQATRLFEKLGIDYCCGGGKSLAEAFATAGIKVEKVMNCLQEASHISEEFEGTDFQAMTLESLINHILNTHHVFTKEELNRLDALLAKVCSVHGQNHSELLQLQGVFRDLNNDLLLHMGKEERVLFPFIILMEEAARNKEPFPAPPFGTVRNPVRMMSFEHDNAGELLRQLRRISSGYTVPQDVCISYRTLYQALEEFERDLHQHIHLENNLLFPRAIEMESSFNSGSSRIY